MWFRFGRFGFPYQIVRVKPEDPGVKPFRRIELHPNDARRLQAEGYDLSSLKNIANKKAWYVLTNLFQ